MLHLADLSTKDMKTWDDFDVWSSVRFPSLLKLEQTYGLGENVTYHILKNLCLLYYVSHVLMQERIPKLTSFFSRSRKVVIVV